ncbi:MAG: hypothetical protein COV48_03430 [Elusimicrobia bacterium CG11_big_fil_rev_8_21_14_0_20_64_6]|nr:MAG: hypothetical protein COV48_03430 [Elusimicrobia bacterium CG11_big_fil_rev_8_21_14_0_20_64_6]
MATKTMLRVLAPIAIVAASLLHSSCTVAARRSSVDAELPKTAAYELLEALDLIHVVPREGLSVGPKLTRHDGSSVARITLEAKAPAEPFSARGLSILQVEMANIKIISLQSFDLLYNARGRIIAVFPVFPDGIAGKDPKKWAEIQPKFFDLSPYYVEVLKSGEPAELDRWTAFAPGFKKDQETIQAFAEERYKALIAAYPNFLANRPPYRLHEIDSATGNWTSHDFSPMVFSPAPVIGPSIGDLEPADFLRLFKASQPNMRRTVIPTYPTVYALYNFTPAELEYLRLVSKKFELAPDAKILVVGPGTGVDAWIASLRTNQPVVAIGINPLEVANTKAAARIAGFKVRAIVGDNVADEKGHSRIPGERFDAVLWSMPAVWPEGFPANHAPSLSDFWDGDVGAIILKRFARALPVLLKPDGHALLWNIPSIIDGRDIVADILETADTGKKLFDVEVQRFTKRKRPKQEWYKDQLYTLSRVSAH